MGEYLSAPGEVAAPSDLSCFHAITERPKAIGWICAVEIPQFGTSAALFPVLHVLMGL
jgi:hypothetical protein